MRNSFSSEVSMYHLNVLIYDDDKRGCESLSCLIKRLAGNCDLSIKTANTMSEAKGFLNRNTSVIFLDIELDASNNGIEFAQYVRKHYPDTKIVFITAHVCYSEDICPIKPDGFLVKPFKTEKLRKVLEYIDFQLCENHKSKISVKITKTEVAQVFLNNIAYIETSGRKQCFYNQDKQKMYSACESMNELEEKLPSNFIRCHHSYCVNLDFTADIQRYYAMLSSGAVIPVSQNRYKTAKQRFIAFLGRNL